MADRRNPWSDPCSMPADIPPGLRSKLRPCLRRRNVGLLLVLLPITPSRFSVLC
jgi:hypothetical protein